MKEHLLNYAIEDLKEYLQSIGEKPFRAKQIFKSLHSGLCFEEMTDLSLQFREKLCNEFVDQPVKIVHALQSKDGTEKFLFKLFDGSR
jgi:23S rRNA (adenine2503-C2)-methyltransferase